MHCDERSGDRTARIDMLIAPAILLLRMNATGTRQLLNRLDKDDVVNRLYRRPYFLVIFALALG